MNKRKEIILNICKGKIKCLNIFSKIVTNFFFSSEAIIYNKNVLTKFSSSKNVKSFTIKNNRMQNKNFKNVFKKIKFIFYNYFRIIVKNNIKA